MKLLTTILGALLLVGTTMFAQQQPPPTNQNGKQTETLTGCLTKGETNGQYVISDQSTGQKYTFPGPAGLDNYVNHTVQLTGTMNNDQSGQKQFRPESIKTVSTTCQGGGH